MVLGKAVFFIMFLVWFFSLSAMSHLWTQDQPVCLCQKGMSFICVFIPNLFSYVQMKTFSCLLKSNNQDKLNLAKPNLLTSLPYKLVSQTSRLFFIVTILPRWSWMGVICCWDLSSSPLNVVPWCCRVLPSNFSKIHFLTTRTPETLRIDPITLYLYKYADILRDLSLTSRANEQLPKAPTGTLQGGFFFL